MKRNKFVHKCGPYKVTSMSQMRGGVKLIVYPAFPRYGESWAISRERDEGGGPGIFTCMGLADRFEDFLNQCYEPAAVEQWKATLEKALSGRKG